MPKEKGPNGATQTMRFTKWTVVVVKSLNLGLGGREIIGVLHFPSTSSRMSLNFLTGNRISVVEV